MDIVCLNGTAEQQQGQEVAQWKRAVPKRWCVSHGWKRGPYSNRSAGCAIILGPRIPRRNIVGVWTAPQAAAGRGLAIRAKSNQFDLGICS
eukprot:4630373-Pyramimonas_sp.AAC.1